MTRLGGMLFVVLTLIGFSSGCGGSVPKGAALSGLLTGQVTFQGNPLKAGTVNLVSKSTGNAASAPLDADGKFVIPEMKSGSYEVFISPPEPIPGPNGEPPQAVPDPIDIPKKYRDAATSGLKADVKQGEPNHFEFPLAP